MDGIIFEDTRVVCTIEVLPENFIKNPSFEESDRSMWKIHYPEGISAHTQYQNKAPDAKTGNIVSLDYFYLKKEHRLRSYFF